MDTLLGLQTASNKILAVGEPLMHTMTCTLMSVQVKFELETAEGLSLGTTPGTPMLVENEQLALDKVTVNEFLQAGTVQDMARACLADLPANDKKKTAEKLHQVGFFLGYGPKERAMSDRCPLRSYRARRPRQSG